MNSNTLKSLLLKHIVSYQQLCCIYFCVILVPFDEDDKDKTVWFLDHDYLENMYGMFKKVNGKFGSLTICLDFEFLGNE